MPNAFLFADEAGCFTFNRNQNVSKYFILCSVLMPECSIVSDLLALRRQLAWEGAELNSSFHATADKQAVRDRVYQVLLQKPFSVQATIMEKSKAQPQVRTDRARFYKYGYYYHFRYGVSKSVQPKSDLLVTTASIGTHRERAAFQNAVKDVMNQTVKGGEWRTDFMPADSDPCLQVADYCAWAIQRKWERGDTRSYDLIKDRISYEYELWKAGTTHYY
jgi:hypothetical protein